MNLYELFGTEHSTDAEAYIQSFPKKFNLTITQEDIDSYTHSIYDMFQSALQKKFPECVVEREYDDIFLLRREGYPTINLEVGPRWLREGGESDRKYELAVQLFRDFVANPKPMEVTIPWPSN